jgi:hypothetical protein
MDKRKPSISEAGRSQAFAAGAKMSKKTEHDTWQERRETRRVELDTPVFARMFLQNSDSSLQVMLTDISPGGAQVLLPPSRHLENVECGTPVTLGEFPPALKPLNGLDGSLAWKGKNNCGIQFDKALLAPLEELIGQHVKL